MKLIICGSRTIQASITCIQQIMDHFKITGITEVISGGARGADTSGEDWAKANQIPIIYFLADWDRHGKFAGYIRNKQMSICGDAALALWDGKSRGTAHMIQCMRDAGKPVWIYPPTTDPQMKLDL